MRALLLPVAAWLAFAPPALAAPTAAASQAWLAAHARMAGVTVRPSGLQMRLIKAGAGRHLAPSDTVQMYFTAKLVDGTVVDGTSPGLPGAVDAGTTLRGLGEALSAMREGDHWEVALPPSLAFGSRGGGGGLVPPDQALVFDVTIVSATPAAMAQAPARDGISIAAGNGGQAAYWTIHP